MEIRWGKERFVLSKRFHAHTLVALIVMHAAAALGVGLGLWWGMSLWFFLYLATGFAVLYLLSGFGITVGNHRFFVHKSFKAPVPVSFAFAILASMGCEQNIMKWGVPHVIHHWFADKPGDPHSPAVPEGSSFGKRLKAFGWAHMGWLISPYAYPHVIVERARRELDSAAARFSEKTHYIWAIAGFALPTLLAFPFWGWKGAL
ncbi:MAG: hypothetical protein Q8P12_05430, partial [bacterium]|nr:hypothetical protein [bacterium]